MIEFSTAGILKEGERNHILRELLPPYQRAGFMQWQMRFGRVVLMALIFIPRFLPGIPDPIGFVFVRASTFLLNLIA